MAPKTLDLQKRRQLAVFLLVCLYRRYRKRRLTYTRSTWARQWILRHDAQGSYNNLVKELSLEDATGYKSYFRLSLEDFNTVLGLVELDITKKDTKLRKCISAGERLAITLRFLATGETFKSLQYTFRVGERTISEIVEECCAAIYNNMKDTFLKVPSSEEDWKKIAKDFELKWNYPYCVGAIDGKHVAIRPPASSGSLYFNYKHFFSIILLALVDADYQFLYVDVGAAGRSGDAGLYAHSLLKRAVDNKTLNLPEKDFSDEAKVMGCSYHMIGDDAFPMTDHLMKPYSHRQQDKDKRIFNYRLSRARRVVENAFGILSNRFRVFLTAINLSPEKVEMIVLAACCLHNYLMQQTSSRSSYAPPSYIDGEDVSHNIQRGEWRNGPEMTSMQSSRTKNSPQSAKDQRELLNSYFLSNVGAVPWQDIIV